MKSVHEDQVREAVIGAFKEIQSLSGREWTSLDDKSRPIGVLLGFDSPNGVEFSCAIELALGCQVPEDDNLCVEDLPKGRRRARTLKEIVTVICKIMESQPEEVNA
jgi:hypothetical protein